MASDWKQSACILCECNCGIEVQLGGADDRHIVRTRGDAAHPASQGYLCQKASRLDHYQNGRDRITQPLRRRADGSFEEIAWDTAISEVAARFAALRERYSGASIFYYGGGGQGNHLPGAYAAATRRALGMRYRSNALAQEKTGEFWVNSRMLGNAVRADFEHCEVALFIGKNPWQSHGIARARITLREIARDPARTLIVIDPVRTETAELADIHLQPRPGTDAWLLNALLGVLWQEALVDRGWLARHATGLDDIAVLLAAIDVPACAAACGVAEERLRATARRIAAAASVAVFEDLGVQMNRHSTLVSYLEKLVWVLTGNFARRGAQYVPASIQSLFGSGAGAQRSPVANAPIISGLVPCNVIADEVLTDHPQRYRGMLIESANPAHSLAESPRFREALAALDTVVVIDVAMTETARLAHYVLPAATQYEKWEATFFNFEYPRNYFHLRRPLFDPPPGPLAEAEIHARLVEALGALPADVAGALREAARRGRGAYREVFFGALQQQPALAGIAPVLLYRTLGPVLPHGAAAAAVLWAPLQMAALREPDALARAGFAGPEAGERLFDAILDGHSGVVFAVEDFADCWKRVETGDGRIRLALPELFPAWQALAAGPAPQDPDYPLVLAAGERRDYTANTIYRDPSWRRKGAAGALRVSAQDAAALGAADGATRGWSRAAARHWCRSRCASACVPGTSRCRTGWGSTTRAATARCGAPAWRRTSSRSPATATSSPARHGTSSFRRGWRSRSTRSTRPRAARRRGVIHLGHDGGDPILLSRLPAAGPAASGRYGSRQFEGETDSPPGRSTHERERCPAGPLRRIPALDRLQGAGARQGLRGVVGRRDHRVDGGRERDPLHLPGSARGRAARRAGRDAQFPAPAAPRRQRRGGGSRRAGAAARAPRARARRGAGTACRRFSRGRDTSAFPRLRHCAGGKAPRAG